MSSRSVGLKQLLMDDDKPLHVVHASGIHATTERSLPEAPDWTDLIPGLPHSVALTCIARVPSVYFPRLKCVCRSWLHGLSAREVWSVRELIGCTEPWICFSFSRRRHRRATNFFQAFDPSSNAWRRIGWMPGLGDEDTLTGYASVGAGGKLYVIGGKLKNPSGGEAAAARRHVYAYDCIAGTWIQCASMRTARVDFACSVCAGNIFVCGGRDRVDQEQGTAGAECYIPELDEWIQLPEMRVARYKCAGVTLGTKVYVIGGYTDSSSPLDRSSVEIFDASTGAWQFVPGMWQLDIPPYQVVELEGQLYRSGDQLNPWRGSIDVYDESLNLWKTVCGSRRLLGGGAAAAGRSRYVTVAGIAGHLLFVGGHCSSEGDRCCFETVDAFEPSTGKWSCLEPFYGICKELCGPCSLVFV